VALAFMFAVFLARPCPFYILDEVEAALDDINIDRFLQLVKRYSDRAQFIVVTHQKRTMDAADTLYGVSMGGDGISRVVSRSWPAGRPRSTPCRPLRRPRPKDSHARSILRWGTDLRRCGSEGQDDLFRGAGCAEPALRHCGGEEGPPQGRCIGSKHADHMKFGKANNRVFAGAGNDTVLGGAGRDRLRGGRGDDVLSAARAATACAAARTTTSWTAATATT
jgi:energy-coupling factor transporter ATP-binding protein EcfA2